MNWESEFNYLRRTIDDCDFSKMLVHSTPKEYGEYLNHKRRLKNNTKNLKNQRKGKRK